MSARPAQLDYAARAARPRGGDARPGRWSSGWVVFCTVVLLGVAGAVVYARDGRPEVIFRLLVEGGLVLVWLAAAAGWGAWPAVWLARVGRVAPSQGVAPERRGDDQRSIRNDAVDVTPVSERTREDPDGPRTSIRASVPSGSSRGTAQTPAFGADLARASPARSQVYRGRGQALLLTTAIALGLGVMSLLVLGLGLAGLLCQISSAALLAAGLGLGGLWAYRARDAWTARPATYRADPMSGSPAWNWLWLAAAPLLAAALVAAFVPPGLLWKPEEPHGYDAVEYHLQVPREWHDAGRIGPTPHNAFGYFPFAVEMHYLLAMHLRGGAWAGMYLAQLMHVAMVALSAVAAWGVASQLARDRRFAVVASVAGATVPWLAQLAPLAFNEGGLLLYGTLTIGWTLIVVRGVGSTPSSLRFLLPGLLAGFACGVKLTAVPLLLLAVPAVALLALLRRSPRLAVLGPLVFGLAGTAAFSPWLIRNVAWTGNPVFPEGTALFGKAHFSDEQVDRWKRAHRPQPAQAGPGARVAALGDQVVRSWQFGYVLLPLAGLALVTSVAVRRGSGGVEDGDGGDDDGGSGDGGPTPSVAGGPVPWMLAGLLLIQLAFWLGFTHLQGRFFLLAVPVAVMCVAVAPWDRLVSGRAGGAVAAALAAVVIVGAAVGWSNVHRRLAHKLYEEQGTGMAVALGRPDIDWITDASLAGFPRDDPSARLLLVGEAQAFWYPLSGDRLVYRTVFDLDTSGGRSLADALDPQGLRRDGRTWRLIAPAELERYQRTYQPLPPIPDSWRRLPPWPGGASFVVPPGVATE